MQHVAQRLGLSHERVPKVDVWQVISHCRDGVSAAPKNRTDGTALLAAKLNQSLCHQEGGDGVRHVVHCETTTPKAIPKENPKAGEALHELSDSGTPFTLLPCPALLLPTLALNAHVDGADTNLLGEELSTPTKGMGHSTLAVRALETAMSQENSRIVWRTAYLMRAAASK